MDRPDQKEAGGAAERRLAILLVFCVAIVAFWEAAALFSRRPFRPFQLTAEDFRSFRPAAGEWAIHPKPVGADPTEPNILAYEFSRAPRSQDAAEPQKGLTAPQEPNPAGGPVLVRLVHGYNMCDCMRIKGYQVELVREVGDPASRRQVWRLTSATREVSIWTTGMIRAGDFGGTDVDVRSMAFPRVGIPDDPRWLPRGVTWTSLRHPISNFRSFLRSKWNSSRCDLATFLGLRQPAWANEELLTLVAAWRGPPVQKEREPAVSAEILAAYDVMYAELRKWRSANEAP